MKNGTIWAISLGAGIPGALLLIGIIGLLIKFFMKRCRTKAWVNISSLPKYVDLAENSTNRRTQKRSSETEPLNPPTPSNGNGVPSGHTTIPIDENDLPPDQRQAERAKQHEHTLVQIQRDRLNRLKEEENRLRPMIRPNSGEDDIRRIIAQVQNDFEESVASASAKLKRRQEL